MTRPLTLETTGDTQVVVRRHFAAPPAAVYRAHTEPALIRRWMTGPDGWTMSRCDHNPDGSIRYDWSGPEGASFHLTGELLSVEPPHRIVHVERMHLPDPTPDNHVETLFRDDGKGGTLMLMTMTLPDAATREAMLATGMADGMEASYARLDGELAEAT
jgi:uncharacterized protein YndB with AHSA1/START domain